MTRGGAGAEWVPSTDGGARPGGGTGVVATARRDYTCGACGEVFTLAGAPDVAPGCAPDDRSPVAPVACPACGSSAVREHWESRLRNAPKTSPLRLEELRDRPG